MKDVQNTQLDPAIIGPRGGVRVEVASDSRRSLPTLYPMPRPFSTFPFFPRFRVYPLPAASRHNGDKEHRIPQKAFFKGMFILARQCGLKHAAA